MKLLKDLPLWIQAKMKVLLLNLSNKINKINKISNNNNSKIQWWH